MICSRMPSEKLPRPSKDPGLRPLKSRMRGSVIDTSRSRNSHIRAPRSVTRALAGDRRQLFDRAVERLGLGLRLADAHVQRDLLHARDLHDAAHAELVLEARSHLPLVEGLQEIGRASCRERV